MKEEITDTGWKFQYEGKWYGSPGDFSKLNNEEKKERFERIKKNTIKKIEDLKINSKNSTEFVENL